MDSIKIEVTGVDKVISNLEGWTRKKMRGVQSLASNTISPKLEAYAKMNRPWTDRTGNARRGLFSRSEVTKDDVVIRLAHTVFYGVYLEKSRAGKYAILVPTMDAHKFWAKNLVEEYWQS